MADDLADFQGYLSNLKETVDNVLQENIQSKAKSSIDTIARAALREILVELGMTAYYSIQEYAENAELAEQFENMLGRSSHISIQDGTVITAFNEDIAGDAIDLFMVPNQRTLTETAPMYWKYGIYGPAHGGPVFNNKKYARIAEKLPSYDEVIAERIAFWGDKAPFWIMIDKGTAAFGEGDRAYPQFAGTNFVDQFRMLAPRVVERAKYIYLTDLAESLGAEIEFLTKDPKKGGRVVIARIPVAEGSLSVLTSSAGNIFFQIGRTAMTFNQAKALVKRTYR